MDIAPGDRLLRIGDEDVSATEFDSVMRILADSDSPLQLTVDDGLARLDITANLAKSLKAEEAVYADLVVRAAVREVRRTVGSYGFSNSELERILF